MDQTKINVYLDQNIWDYKIKNKFPPIQCIINNKEIPLKLQYYYSYVTLEEIARAEKENQNDFLNQLKDDGALYLQVDHKTENGFFNNIDPCTAFKNHKDENNSIQTDFQDMSYNLIAGKKDRNYSVIFQSLVNSLRYLLEDEAFDIDSNIQTDDGKSINDLKNELLYSSEILFNQMGISFDDIIKNNTGLPLKEIKKLLPFSSQDINNISPDKIVSNLWDRLKATDIFNIESNNLDKYLESWYFSIYPNSEWNWISKINILYMALNFLGYWQDENLEKKNKFIPSLNDGSHAYYASFGNIFITRDKRFARKLQAVYHHYNIQTYVVYYSRSSS